MAWKLERYISDPRADGAACIMLGSGGSPDGVQTAPKGTLACYRDAATEDLLWHVNIDGSTAWSVAFKPGALAWYTGAITNPVADSADGVHASNGDDTQTWPAPSSPATPRNISVTAEAAWAGGDVTFVGTDINDAALSEVITPVAGSLVYGAKAFKTVTGITHAALGPGGANHNATAGWGHTFGVDQTLAAAIGHLTCDGIDDAATWDATNNAFTPTTLPNGAHDYAWAVPT